MNMFRKSYPFFSLMDESAEIRATMWKSVSVEQIFSPKKQELMATELDRIQLIIRMHYMQ